MNPPSNTPPPVPGPGSQPSSGMPSGASGGAQQMPPNMLPPAKSGGGLFSARNIIIGLVALAFLCVCGCGAIVLALGPISSIVGNQISNQLETQVPGGLGTAQVTIVGQTYMTSLKNGDWAAAFALCTPDLQKELKSASDLGKRITDGKSQPVSWTFQDFSPITPTSNDAQIDGTAAFSGNRTGTLRLVFDRSGSDWKISGFNLQPK